MLEARNPVRTRAGHIDLEINHPEYGWIPFTATPCDCETLGLALYHRAEAGEFGSVSAYVEDPAELVTLIIEWRTRELLDTDHLIQPDYPLTDEKRAALKTYRQALRDITSHPDFPQETCKPTPPDWLK